jgi:hypothetical protein
MIFILFIYFACFKIVIIYAHLFYLFRFFNDNFQKLYGFQFKVRINNKQITNNEQMN